MRALAVAAIAVVVSLSLDAAMAGPRSGSGPRGPAGDVPFAPVDRTGPTLPPDGVLQPDSGWNGSGSAGVSGPNYRMVQPLFGPALPTLKRKRKPYIILNE